MSCQFGSCSDKHSPKGVREAFVSCAEHLGHPANAGNHGLFWGGADFDELEMDYGRHCSAGGLMRWGPGHELLLFRSAGGHIRHIILGHRQRLQSPHHPGQPSHVGQALK